MKESGTRASRCVSFSIFNLLPRLAQESGTVPVKALPQSCTSTDVGLLPGRDAGRGPAIFSLPLSETKVNGISLKISGRLVIDVVFKIIHFRFFSFPKLAGSVPVIPGSF